MQATKNTIELDESGIKLSFNLVPLEFIAHGLSDVFANKNNKSLKETLSHRRYQSLSKQIIAEYSQELDKPLGAFLAELKARGDSNYRLFLNPNGDKTYCHFKLTRGPHAALKGLYLYACYGETVYIGRSYDPFIKRVDQGYGKIHPKNCFIDGQSLFSGHPPHRYAGRTDHNVPNRYISGLLTKK